MSNIIKSTQYDGRAAARGISLKTQHRKEQQVNIPSEEEIVQQQEELIAQANAQADRIISEATHEGIDRIKALEDTAKQEMDNIIQKGFSSGKLEGFAVGKQQGFTAGFDEGYQEGLQRAYNENQGLLKSLERLVESFQEEKRHTMDEFMKELDPLVLNIAKAVIKKEISLNPKMIIDVAYQAVENHIDQAWIKIYLSEATLSKALEIMPDLSDRLGSNVKLLSKPDFQDGDCVCETPAQIIDVGVDRQFDNIQKILTEAK